MPNDWDTTPIGTLVDVHNRERVPLSKLARSERQGPFRYFGAQGVVDHIDDFIFDGDYLLVAEDGENLRSRKEPISRMVSGKFWVNNHAHVLSTKPALADDRFLMHVINITPFSGRVTGAAQPKLTKTNLLEQTVRCPPMPTQRRISAVLSTFDELIEINERRIALLEDLARSLYREWFVHLRFPGHERVQFAETAVGAIPQGWEVRSLFDIADVAFGFSFKSSRFVDGDGSFPVIRIRDLPRGTTDTFTDEEPDSRYQVLDGDILIGMDGEFYVREWSAGPAWLNQRVARLRPRGDLGRRHLMLAVEGPIRAWNDAIVGTTVAHLGKRHLEQIQIPLPPSPLLQAAGNSLDAFADQEANLKQQCRLLAAARDLLLPRLVTGKLDVSHLDLGFVDAARVA